MKTLLLSTYLIMISNWILSQETIPTTVKINEVVIEDNQKTVEKTIGYHNKKSIGTNLFTLKKGQEIGLLIESEQSAINLLKIHLRVSEVELKKGFLLVSIRDVDSLNLPSTKLFSKRVKVKDLSKDILDIDLSESKIFIPQKNFYLTLKLEKDNPNNVILIPMTKKGRSETFICENKSWRTLNSPISRHWNAKFGVTLEY